MKTPHEEGRCGRVTKATFTNRKGSTMARTFAAMAAFLAILVIALSGVAGSAERESATATAIQVYANAN